MGHTALQIYQRKMYDVPMLPTDDHGELVVRLAKRV